MIFLGFNYVISHTKKDFIKKVFKYMTSHDFWRNNGINDKQCGCFNMTWGEDGKLLSHWSGLQKFTVQHIQLLVLCTAITG